MKFSEYVELLKNKKIDVLGMGVSNRPLIHALAEAGCQVKVHDRSDVSRLGAEVEELRAKNVQFVCGEGYLEHLDGDVIFRTPGIHPDIPSIREAVARGAELTSEMEAFFRVCPCRIIAVTGSDGKTTTTTIISELLKSAGFSVHVGGNIGAPLLCGADEMKPEDFAVLELSSFQLMTLTQAPSVAVITNVAPNHLDVHKDMDEYIKAKANIFRYQTADERVILNADNAITKAFAESAPGLVSFFSRKAKVNAGFYCSDGKIFSAAHGFLMEAKDIRIPGTHNIENYLAAFSAVEGLVPSEIMINVAKTFNGVEHRIEFVRELNGVRYYNDSIASSPSRTMAALHSFDEKLIVIAGGKDKGVPFDELGKEFVDHVKILVLTGWTAEKLRTAVEKAPAYQGIPKIITEDDFKTAVQIASKEAECGDVVILTPACTSFDKFKNFAERGNFYKQIVMELE